MTRRDLLEAAALIGSGALVGAVMGDVLTWLVHLTNGSGSLWSLRALFVGFGAFAATTVAVARSIHRSRLGRQAMVPYRLNGEHL